MIEISREAIVKIIGAALDAYPLEMCGLLVGPTPHRSPEFHQTRNDEASARVYTINPKDFMHIDMHADNVDWQINGVVHSHTHSEPYPSPTDVAAAVDPTWHYVIVSLKRSAPEVRSYLIVDGSVVEEQIALL